MSDADPHSDISAGAAWREFAIVCAVGCLLLAIAVWRTAPMGPALFAQPWDYHKYIYIAQHGPLNFHIAPFCWRFLHPLIAGLLPFELNTSFKILAAAETLGASILAYYLARAAGFSKAAGFMALLVYYSVPAAAAQSVFNPWGVDPLSRLMVFAGFYFLLKNRLAPACIVFCVGVCAKETVVIATPLVYAWTARKWWDSAAFRQSFLFAAPILGTFVAVRLLIPAWNANPEYVNSLPFSLTQVYDNKTTFVYSELIVAILRLYSSTPLILKLRIISLSSFGVFAFLPFFALREIRVPLLRLSPFLLLAFIAMLFSSGWDRVLVIAFPAVEILALHGLRHLVEMTHAPEPLFAVSAIPICLVTFLKSDSDWRYFVPQVLIFALALAAAVVWGRLVRHESASMDARAAREGG